VKSWKEKQKKPLTKGDPIAPALVRASMYHLPGDPDGYPGYGRSANPTWDVVETALGDLEHADCVLFPSGMAAITASLVTCVNAGDRILIPSDGYYATRVLADRFLAPLGVRVDTCRTLDFEHADFDGCAVVFVETPSNPGLDVIDIKAVSEAAHRVGATVIVDNTTMTPFGQRPLELGADIVVASDTKAPGGHSDLLMGHAATRDAKRLEAMRDWRTFSGSIPGPDEAWLLHRGLQTLAVRLDRMCQNAEVLAERFLGFSCLKTVRYPGLLQDPAFALASRQMTKFGFLIGLEFDTETTAETFINGCDQLQAATSFGGVHSSAERRKRWGDDVSDGFVRLSVGCEPVEGLWASIEDSLKRI
jgi:cystathionine gamma-lyase